MKKGREGEKDQGHRLDWRNCRPGGAWDEARVVGFALPVAARGERDSGCDRYRLAADRLLSCAGEYVLLAAAELPDVRRSPLALGARG
jgi:hypothetical protein